MRANPQDIPYSPPLTLLTVGVYALLTYGITLSVTPMSGGKAVFYTLMDCLILVGLGYAALWIKNQPQRRSQTLAALVGTSVLLTALSWPLHGLIIAGGEEGNVLSNLASLAIFVLAIWQIVVIGHILRHALEVSMPVGVGIALMYAVLSLKVSLFIGAN